MDLIVFAARYTAPLIRCAAHKSALKLAPDWRPADCCGESIRYAGGGAKVPNSPRLQESKQPHFMLNLWLHA